MAAVPTPHAPDREARREASDWIDLLYRSHGRRVLAICVSLLRNRDEAEDAAQQAFLSAYRARLNGTAPREPAAWLATIARNECWSRLRATASEAPTETPAPTAEPADDVIQRAELSEVWQAIADLPDGQREALLLREIRGLSYDQLAESLSVTRPSIRSLLSRARQRVHDQVRSGVAGLSGIPGLEPLARLFASSPESAMSTAAKAAAVGVGATALLGGAVAVPRLVPDSPRPPARSQAAAAPREAGARASTRGSDRPLPPALVTRGRDGDDSAATDRKDGANRGPTTGGRRGSGGTSGESHDGSVSPHGSGATAGSAASGTGPSGTAGSGGHGSGSAPATSGSASGSSGSGSGHSGSTTSGSGSSGSGSAGSSGDDRVSVSSGSSSSGQPGSSSSSGSSTSSGPSSPSSDTSGSGSSTSATSGTSGTSGSGSSGSGSGSTGSGTTSSGSGGSGSGSGSSGSGTSGSGSGSTSSGSGSSGSSGSGSGTTGSGSGGGDSESGTSGSG